MRQEKDQSAGIALALLAVICTLASASPVLAHSASMTDGFASAPFMTASTTSTVNLSVESIAGSPCDSITCPPGSHCIQIPGGVACVPDTADPCYQVPCPAYYHCVGGLCLSDWICDFISCAEGSRCVNTPIGAGCIYGGVCETFGCREGFHCVENQEGAACIPNSISCDDIFCAEGFHCVDTPPGPGCFPDAEPVEPSTWGHVKAMFR